MMKKITVPIAGRRIRISVLGLAGFLVLLGILCSLGNWQLQRADEKRLYLQQQQLAQKAERIMLNRLEHVDLKSMEYKKVSVKGAYDEAHQFLIDNQIKDGKVGYLVMTPFIIAGRNQAVLVNRGWVPMNKDRSIKPDIRIEKKHRVLSGRVNHFPVVGMALKGADIPTDTWPAVVQVINTEILDAKLGYSLLGFQIELDADQPGGYEREWKNVSIMPPEKHIAYAMQWFALAITLTVLFVWYHVKNNE